MIDVTASFLLTDKRPGKCGLTKSRRQSYKARKNKANKMTEKIRTRFAPSPTGFLHIGGARTALFNWLYARHNGGEFVLRIEDTDQTRSTRESEQAIFDALRWVGIPYDEGPDVGGPHGPYRQSERLPLYREHCAKLLANGTAYPCFCSDERLKQLRAQQNPEQGKLGYDGHCAALPADEARRRMAAGEKHVIRLRVPTEGDCVIHDRLRGEIRIGWAMVDHQILLKSDGFPTYHLANVVDDHLMQITHVIRGEEWISSTPKHLLLYQAFGWQPPEFAHLPLLRNPDKSKLSKRKNPTSILYYQRAGYLPEALINYLGLMAYSMPDGRETFSIADLAATFELDRISLGGPVFDLPKLRAFNGRYLRDLEPAALQQRLKDWLLNDDSWLKILPLARPRLEQLTDLVPMSAYLFADKLNYEAADLLKAGLEGEATVRLLRIAQWEIEKLNAWNADLLKELFNRIGEKENLKLKQLMPLFFVALSGSPVALPIFESMAFLGKDMTLRRIVYAIETLAAQNIILSGKKLKELTSYHQATYGAAV